MTITQTQEILSCGTQLWLKDGLPHRLDGPAVSWNDSTEIWYICGMVHRSFSDGPAVTFHDREQYVCVKSSKESLKKITKFLYGDYSNSWWSEPCYGLKDAVPNELIRKGYNGWVRSYLLSIL